MYEFGSKEFERWTINQVISFYSMKWLNRMVFLAPCKVKCVWKSKLIGSESAACSQNTTKISARVFSSE